MALCRRTRARDLVAGTVLTALAACGGPERGEVIDGTLPFAPSGPGAAPDPSREGPYPIGVMTRTLADASRTDYVPPKGARQLPVEIFYPAVESSRGDPRQAFEVADGVTAPALAQLGAEHGATVLPSRAARGAALREGRYPLVLFSHGAGGFRLQSYPWLERLASHGFVVASVEHPGDTLSDFVLLGQQELAGRLIMANVYRRDDLSFVLTTILADAELGGHVDPQRVGASGHSHGAVSAVQLSRRDARVRSLVLHAPPACATLELFDGVPAAELGIPVLVQAGDLDRITPPETTASAYDCFTGPKARERYARAGHFTFSIACRLPRSLLERASMLAGIDLVADGCADQNLPIDEAELEVGAHLVAHFNATLRDSPSSAEYLRRSWITPGDSRYDASP